MLTRLRVKGFKNLVDVDVRFGPFTVIAGPNAVGKSNLFDAIHFLSLLADKPFVEAANEVRGSGHELDTLFTKGGDGVMRLECDVLIPSEGKDDFNQPAQASSTFLTYVLDLRLDTGADSTSLPRIRLEHEELTYVKKKDAQKRLGFHYDPVWFRSVVPTLKRTTTFITTKPRKGLDGPVVRLQSDRMQDLDKSKRGGGKPVEYAVERLPRTVLSSAQNAEETRTAVLLRQEMRQWRQLQLEPSQLRRPDDFHDPNRINGLGGHIPATLFRLSSLAKDADRVYSEVANRLAQLVDGIRHVRVERDMSRKLFRFMMTDQSNVELPASSLSDGTLRFVALAVIEQDPEATGVLCLEEPENGIHPERVEAMLRLLTDLAVDPRSEDANADNPLRQVITTTHSPVVISHADVDDVLFARTRKHSVGTSVIHGIEFVGLNDSWRASEKSESLSKGQVISFLGAVLPTENTASQEPDRSQQVAPPVTSRAKRRVSQEPDRSRRVADVVGLQLDFPFGRPE